MRELANYVGTACGGDYPKLLGSGFPTHKPRREPIGRLAKPRRPMLNRGAMSGWLDARTKSVRGSFIFNWKVALASAPDVPVQTLQTTRTKASLFGLKPGQTYVVEVNVVGALGPSDWISTGPIMVV